jgi:hypothetical protein
MIMFLMRIILIHTRGKMSQLKLCSTCKEGKFRAKEEGNTRELACDYCGQKCSDEGLNEYV